MQKKEKVNHIMRLCSLFANVCLLFGCTNHNISYMSKHVSLSKNIDSVSKETIDETCANEILCSCLLYPLNKYIYIYDKPKGDVVDSIANDSVKDNYALVYILKTEKDYFYVDAEYVSDFANEKQKTNHHRGWILKGNLYIHLVGDVDSVVYLYEKPSLTMAKVDSVNYKYWWNSYIVHDCKGGWLQIDYNRRKLWVKPENQCANPFTTCG